MTNLIISTTLKKGCAYCTLNTAHCDPPPRFTNFKTLLFLALIWNFLIKKSTRRENYKCGAWWISAKLAKFWLFIIDCKYRHTLIVLNIVNIARNYWKPYNWGFVFTDLFTTTSDPADDRHIFWLKCPNQSDWPEKSKATRK